VNAQRNATDYSREKQSIYQVDQVNMPSAEPINKLKGQNEMTVSASNLIMKNLFLISNPRKLFNL